VSFLLGFLIYNLVSGLPDIYISEKTEQIGATWSQGNVWDKPLIEKFYSLLKWREDAFVVLDIGAQTGCLTLLAKYFLQSTWHAFEPIQEAAVELKANLALNQLTNVSVHQVCVSNRSGEAVLKLPKDTHWGLATLGEKGVRFHTCEERTVPCITLDEFVQKEGLERVDFIKVDTEGWEFFVLQGGEAVLRKFRPIILMEFNRDNMRQCCVSPDEIVQLLESLSYTWQFVSSEDILCTPVAN